MPIDLRRELTEEDQARWLDSIRAMHKDCTCTASGCRRIRFLLAEIERLRTIGEVGSEVVGNLCFLAEQMQEGRKARYVTDGDGEDSVLIEDALWREAERLEERQVKNRSSEDST